MKQTKRKVVACTIANYAYLSQTRTLVKSFKKYHPEIEFYVLLIDEERKDINLDKEDFHVVPLDKISIESKPEFLFKYSIFEASCALKPRIIKYVLNKTKSDTIIYLDSDLMFFNTIDSILAKLGDYDMIITPHILTPLPEDDKMPSEVGLMRGGSYNMGFLAINATPEIKKLIDWWEKRLYEYAISDVANGLFTDQKWMDLAPSLVENLLIDRNPGFNAAYWNLHERQNLVKRNGKMFINKYPLVFYHFSGFPKEDLNSVSKHQNRYTLQDLPQNIRVLYEEYSNSLDENGYHNTINTEWAYSKFDNGVKISNLIRRIYYNQDVRERFGNPFVTKHSGSFFNWLRTPIKKNSPINNLIFSVYQSRPDLMAAFPDIEHTATLLHEWAVEHLPSENQIDDCFLSTGNQKNQRFNIQRYSSVLTPRKLPRLLISKAKGKILKKTVSQKSQPGINISGFLDAESGVGELSRGMIRNVKATNIPHSLNNYMFSHAITGKSRYSKEFTDSNPHPINLLVHNAIDIPEVINKKGASYFKNKYNIGYWAWELDEFPDEWIDRFEMLDEIWTPSKFNSDSISQKSSIPVVTIPPSIRVANSKWHKRSHFDLPEDKFVFLYIFSYLSSADRKNPIAAIEAFKQAFSHKDDSLLIIKCSNHQKYLDHYSKMQKSAQNHNIEIMPESRSQKEIHSLINCSDAYVSPHRSEGFGLTMAEAMYLGKPVIATGYSGNTDFMYMGNSYPVKFELVEIEKDTGPYKKGNYWAEPSIDHLSELMRLVYSNTEEVKSVASRGQKYLRTQLSPKIAGKTFEKRVDIISKYI